jgi:Tfp pilus assembly protein PilO
MNRNQKWSVLTALIVVMILGGTWYAAIEPQSKHAASIRSQAASQQTTNQGLLMQIKTLQAQSKGVVADQARVAAIAKELPPSAEMASYVRLLVATASAAQVDLISISPGAATTLTVASAPVAAAPVTATPSTAAGSTSKVVGSRTTTGATGGVGVAPAAGSVTSAGALSGIPITLAINGGYFQIQQFIAQLEKMPRATIVTSISLTPGAALTAAAATGAAAGNAPAAAAAPAVAPWRTLAGAISIEVFDASLPAVATPSPTPTK